MYYSKNTSLKRHLVLYRYTQAVYAWCVRVSLNNYNLKYLVIFIWTPIFLLNTCMKSIQNKTLFLLIDLIMQQILKK